MTERDDEIHRLQRELEAMRREQEAMQRDLRDTSYDEYLRLCHEEIFTTLQIQTKAESTRGGITNVTNKHYPLKLRPWDEFLEEQRRHHRIIQETIPGFLLPSKREVRSIAEALNRRRPVASEQDLRTFEHLAVEDPVEIIFAAFGTRSQDQPSGREFECKKILFDNQPHSANNSSNSDAVEALGKNMPDKWVLRTSFSGDRCIVFPVEYKAAHKISLESFQVAMRKEDLFTRVISRISSGKISNDEETKLQEKMEDTVAKALAQTFHYMVHIGTSYGYLTNGKSLIFLHIRGDPSVLYYHLSQPETDAKGRDGSIDPFYTAVAQLSAFCLRACQDSGKPISWKEIAMQRLNLWPQPYPEMLGATPEEEESPQSTRSDSSYAGPITAAKELTVALRRTTRASCKPMPELGANDTSDDDSGGDSNRRTHGLQPSLIVEVPGPKKRKDPPSGSEETRSSEELELEARPYCTQECMLGLKRNGLLDEKCPNAALHRRASRSMSHPIDAASLRKLLREELGRPVYRLRSVKPLDGEGKYGATGSLFKLSLPRYGYTFAGKGTFAAAVKRLQHEEEVYTRIEPLQGHFSPVCLGSIPLDTPLCLGRIPLDKPYPLEPVVHMLLMSWAGDELTSEDEFLPEQKGFRDLLRKYGVVHNDMRQSNFLRNHERGRIMLIDFDVATIQPPVQHKQVKRLSHKREKHLRRDSGTVSV